LNAELPTEFVGGSGVGGLCDRNQKAQVDDDLDNDLFGWFHKLFGKSMIGKRNNEPQMDADGR
jgi:hypothetical protein